MKYLMLLITSILFSVGVEAKSSFNEGYKTPQEAINAFLNPLKRGKEGIKDSMRAADGLNGENPEDSQIAQTLLSDMKAQGKVKKFKQTDSYSRLGGNMQKFTYEIEYSSGKKRELNFTILRPGAGSGYYIMGMGAE